jgi:hypothetical protein
MTDDAPPLRTWGFPILASLAIVLSFLYYSYSNNGPYAKTVALSNKNLESALIENTRDTSALSIVIFGSSLTEHALVDPRALEDSIYKRTNRKAKVLRVALSYLTPSVAQDIDFFDYIVKYPPNYLFVENFSFNLTHGDTTALTPDPINLALLNVRNIIRNAIGKPALDNYYIKWYTFDGKPQPGDIYYTHEFDSVMFKKLLHSKSSVRKMWQNNVINTAFDALAKNNTRVVFLDIPLNKLFPHNFMDQPTASELNKLLTVYKTRYHVDYWRFPYVMDNSFFTDGAHMNSKGGVQYQKWFVSEIAGKKYYEATH